MHSPGRERKEATWTTLPGCTCADRKGSFFYTHSPAPGFLKAEQAPSARAVRRRRGQPR